MHSCQKGEQPAAELRATILPAAEVGSLWFCWALLHFLCFDGEELWIDDSRPDVRLCCCGRLVMFWIGDSLQTVTQTARREPAVVEQGRRPSEADICGQRITGGSCTQQRGRTKKLAPDKRLDVYWKSMDGSLVDQIGPEHFAYNSFLLLDSLYIFRAPHWVPFQKDTRV